MQRAGTNTRVLDAAGGGTGNGTNVQLHTVNNTPAQLWRVSRDAEGYYTLANAKSGKVLDVRLAKAGNGANVQLYRSNGTKAQKWLAERKGSGYVLKSALDARYVLDCAGGSVDAGTNIQLYKGNGSTAQCFRFADANPQVEAAGRTVADGVYQIATSLSGKAVLDVANGSAAKGANIRLYAANQSTAQRWYVRMGADGFYTLVSLESGMALDVDRGIKLTANVQQYTPNGSDAQKWSISENTDGTYSLASKCNGLRLAVQGAKTANGTNVIVTSSSASAAQKFAFKAVPVLADGYYSFFSKLGQTGYALDVKGNSVAQGARVQLWTANSSPAQRFKLSHLGDGIYSIQAVASGKYLADAGGKVVQQARNGDLADVQKWKVTARPSGVSLENLATGGRWPFRETGRPNPRSLRAVMRERLPKGSAPCAMQACSPKGSTVSGTALLRSRST